MVWKKDCTESKEIWCWKYESDNDSDFIYAATLDWNPFLDENHGRQVIERMMSAKHAAKVWIPFIKHFKNNLSDYMESTLPERMDAVVSVLPKE